MSLRCYTTIKSHWIKLFFVVLTVSISVLKAEIPQDKLRKLEEAHIIPDYGKYLNHFVEAQINFEGPGHITADFGNLIDLRTITKEPPEIRWVAEVGEYYTVALIDPDEPRDPPQPVEKIYWMLINVPGCWLLGGQEVIPYRKPENPKNEGEVHRIIALVYHQLEGQMNVTEPFLRSKEITESMRNTFRIRKFAEKYDLLYPFAMNFFRAEYLGPKRPPKGQKNAQQQNQQRKKQQNKKQKPQQQQQQPQQQKKQKQQQEYTQQQTRQTQPPLQQTQEQQQQKTPSSPLPDHQQHTATTSTQNEDTETTTLTLIDLAHRQAILDSFRQRDQRTQDDEQQQDDWFKEPTRRFKSTTMNPILAIYMRDHIAKLQREHQKEEEQKRQKQQKQRKEQQMPDVPDTDDLIKQYYENEKAEANKPTTTNPIRAAYMKDLKEKQKQKRKQEDQGTQAPSSAEP